jgi:glutathione synthase/RimK-type ligase-like ATP-grasp enzyme
MRVAVHPTTESFCQRWLVYLKDNGINHSIINAYDTGIMEEISKYDVLLWHWYLRDPVGMLNAGPIMRSIEGMGVKVFPDHATSWHYDDKVAQKYLLESIDAPLIPSHVFYQREAALAWAENALYPTVFKLKRGAGSHNVKLVRDKAGAIKIINQMFAGGISASPHYFTDAKSRFRKINSVDDVFAKVGRFPAALKKLASHQRLVPKEKGYVLFQDFMPKNEYDTRIVVIGEKAFGIKRMNRPGDFRASGGGSLVYDHKQLNEQFVQVAFSVSKRLKFQSMAYDFLYDGVGKPVICEISFCFDHGEVYHKCEGHWTPDLVFHPGHEYMEDVILENLLISK